MGWRLLRTVALVAVLAVVGGMWPAGSAAQPGAVRVLASNGVKAAIEALAPAAGRPLVVTFGTSAGLRLRIESGEAFDVAVLTREAIDALAEAGHLDRGSVAPLGRSGIGMGVRAGAPKPDISSSDALREALVRARSITYAGDGASRVHLERMFEGLGIGAQVREKTALEQGSINATARVARGDSDLVLTLVSEILPVAGIDLVGPLPAAFQTYLEFAAAASPRASSAADARAVVAFLSGAQAAPAFTTHGFDR